MAPRPVMIGTAFDTRGGIASVVNVYRAHGFFERHGVVYLATHRDGSALAKLAAFLTALGRFWGMLARREVALLHVHLSSRASFWRKLLFLLPASALRVPTLVHLHGSEFAVFYERECGRLGRRLVRTALDRATVVVALSETWRRWLAGVSANPRILVLYNPVAPPPPTPWRDRGDDILSLGRIGRRKGSFDLLEAFSLARRAQPSTRLRLGGDGDGNGLAQAALKLGLSDRLDLLGWVVGERKADELARARLFALPSYHEGLPMGLLEAMAAGLPVLTCPVGGIAEAVDDGVEGLLVPPGDVPALERGLWRLLSEPDLAERMGAAARRRVQRQFSVEVLMPKLDALYDELLDAASDQSLP